MASSKKISGLTNSLTESSIANADLFVVVDTDAAETKKITREDLKQDMLAGNADTCTTATNASKAVLATTTDASCSVALFDAPAGGAPQLFKTDTGLTYDASADVLSASGLTVSGTTTTYLNVITDATTARTPGLTDAGAYLLMTSGSAITVTLPKDATVAHPVGTHIIFERRGSGTLTFAAEAGGVAVVNSKGGTLTCADQYTSVAAVKVVANTWTLLGNIG